MKKGKDKELTMEVATKVVNALARSYRVDVLTRGQAERFSWVEGVLRSVVPHFDKIENAVSKITTALGYLILVSDEDRKTPLGYLRACVHQIEHCVQAQEHRFETVWLYTTSPETRARMEAHAYAAEMEVAYWLTGELPKFDELAWPFEADYKLSEENVKLARQILEARLTSAVQGQAGSQVAQGAISLLIEAGVEPMRPAPTEGTGGA
jgi:hypothetical protein